MLEKFTGRHIPEMVNTVANLDKHQQITKGILRFRFPPEPNGYLHLGHAKSMFLNFSLAGQGEFPFLVDSSETDKVSDATVDVSGKHQHVPNNSTSGRRGICYLRFDDTNPDTENTEFTDAIVEMVNWLGWKPDSITYTSDYFLPLYDCAIQLIKMGKAYVDFSTQAEISQQRKTHQASPYRDQSVSDALKLFQQMTDGHYQQGEATLRLKMDITSPNPNLHDLIAYRVRLTPHHRTGTDWKIYPSYDFAHCLVDSFEQIDYSLCTLEFENRRESYYWILHALDLYKPIVWEFSRLSLQNNTLSKRLISSLITQQTVESWSDPRLLTLVALRRRGISPECINRFCQQIGINRNQAASIETSQFEHAIRESLNLTAERRFAIIDPLEVRLLNYENPITVLAKNHPLNPEFVPAERELIIDSPVIYLEKSDFRITPEKKYYGLKAEENSTVGLKYGPNLIFSHLELDPNSGQLIRIYCYLDVKKTVKPKTHIHWLPENNSQNVPIIKYQPLNLASGENGTKIVYAAAKIENNLEISGIGRNYQFERLGYYILDRESPPGEPRYLETISLKKTW